MRSWKSIAIAFLLSLVLWLAFSWPVPRTLTTGIPSSGRNVEAGQVRYMIPGDHLQFLYHLWLFNDTLSGHTPWFHNLYEFNTGDDTERRAVTTYYLPFALVFALFAHLGSAAFAWNLTGFIALWFTFLATLSLVRRYSTDRWIPWIAALIAILFPYRWYALLGGSPTGLGMMWIPFLLLGIEEMVAEQRARGGILAGLTILFAGWVDSHVFFFAALIAPAWCLFAYWYHRNRWSPTWREFKPLLKAALPLLGFLVLILFQAHLLQRSLADTDLARQGRNPNEVWLSSPKLAGVLTRDIANPACVIYAGWSLLGLLVAGLLAFLTRCARRHEISRRQACCFILLLLGITGIIFLAAGMNNPGGPRLWRWLTQLLPPYAMIRNPTKIYCLLPTVAAVATALALNHLCTFLPHRGVRRVVLGLLVLLLLVDFKGMIQPTICLLERHQAAYEAVARDAHDYGRRAHLLALPLWPGDSHFTSVNQYYATMYRLRMVNGYRPTVRKKYFDEIFLRFQSFNRGQIAAEQLDELLRRGINYVVLHEDAFPEKVSPFPVGTTLHALTANARLLPLCQDRNVQAFRILATDEIKPDRKVAPDCTVYFPARRWEFESCGNSGAGTVRDPACGGSGFLRLAQSGTWVTTTAVRVSDLADLRWMIRGRGEGAVRALARLGDRLQPPLAIEFHTNGWEWRDVPLHEGGSTEPASLRVEYETGNVELDLALLTAGSWPELKPGESLTLDAPCFFHAGYSAAAPGRAAVVLRRDYDPAAAVFYGPKLPLAAGTYEVEFRFSSDAPAGTLLGTYNLRVRERDERNQAQVIAGRRVRIVHCQPDNRPVNLVFVYTRNADMEIEGVTITRRE